MIRLDKRNPNQIKVVIKWSQIDDFWQDNILSTVKLRKQFDQLVLKMKKEKQNDDKKNFGTCPKCKRPVRRTYDLQCPKCNRWVTLTWGKVRRRAVRCGKCKSIRLSWIYRWIRARKGIGRR